MLKIAHNAPSVAERDLERNNFRPAPSSAELMFCQPSMEMDMLQHPAMKNIHNSIVYRPVNLLQHISRPTDELAGQEM